MRLDSKLIAIACASIAMSACQPKADGSASAAPAPASPFDEPDVCGAGKLAGWVGEPDNAQSRAVIAKTSGALAIRWITPGMAVTMDFNPNRLNANIAADGRYTGFNCS